ncbi:MAG: hypothetical protein F6K11_14210 [Leptolyngbya sp. SIO3F4]|nr:hypothetical protein [Leptolyngbya sp. SIO3F4]
MSEAIPQQNELAKKLDQLIAAVTELQQQRQLEQEQNALLREEVQTLRSDLLKFTATGWQSPEVVAKALGFKGKPASLTQKMHRLRDDGKFGRLNYHYRLIGTNRYQYHIGNCNKALAKST